MSDVTRILDDIERGDSSASERLLPLVYDELRRLAAQRLAKEPSGLTLQATALVHEAYLRLVDQSQINWQSRAHFLGVAAKAMRHILTDYARRKQALKRGGDISKVSLDNMPALAVADHLPDLGNRVDELVALDEALKRLSEINERQARLVECRYFGGMTIPETAEALNVSPATVKRSWVMAQAWLYRELKSVLED